ncbi:hypothetical protein C8R45DRAFT_1096404 [Mycena sanguinolenta]|nr:hypothetical protein C8R45DRAFT_1096404 [Mycena sanguinolenta]
MADDIALDYTDVVAEFGGGLRWVNPDAVSKMPNPMRQLVDDDEDLHVVMVSPWADDVSGNKSKQYNKHMNMYTDNGCLPGRLLQQEFNIHYISTSPHASSAEQFATFRDHVKSTEKNPIKCYNAATKRRCRHILRTPGLPADNPQQSEESSHMGDMKYHECHLVGIARNAQEIRETLQEQLQLSMLGNAEAVKENLRSTGTKDKVTQYWIEMLLGKAKALKAASPRRDKVSIASELKTWLEAQPGDKMKPLLDIVGLDPSQDTPVELLHTILLGVVKYIWHMLNTTRWSDDDRCLLAIRLQSTDITGLTVPPIHVDADTCLPYSPHLDTRTKFVLVKAAGELGARLWVPEIDDMEEYLSQLKIVIANVLDAFDAIDPLRILDKIKLHLLAHIPDDIRRFGPLIRSATEIYEAYNGVFRLCSVFSNRLAPSRDISRKFASMSRVKHSLSGGYWWDSSLKQWIQAGNAVQEILRTDSVFQRHLGWVSPKTSVAGSIKPIPLTKKAAVEWNQTKASAHWSSGTAPAADSWWRFGCVLTAQSGDEVGVSSWVIAHDSGGKSVIGRVAELLVAEKSLVTLERIICSKEPHPDFNWPILRRPAGLEITEEHMTSFLVLPASSIQFIFSVQHDCRKGDCQPVAVRKEIQERQETDRNVSLVKHADDDHFVVNMAALHNFVRLCRALPRTFTELRPLYPDRVAFHKSAAEKGRALRTKKPEQAAEAAVQAEEAVARGQDPDQSDEDPQSDVNNSDCEGNADSAGAGDDEEDVPEAESRSTRGRKRRRLD